ncbi:substrate-binding periplasmic protein [Desulfovibrio psychrotolerans]|uniref:Solute-binding protein family 3/N-terminal domain-containing protein n=1 Tax=Desulfovibrio psychrotolerans TaxID=415242 RepID=A0A7J0BS12_9BACT|nr:transporter substrate-binding domain-containing protein [Desulfovibrio psychrotolerans]GFM36487.1 hypothetical protein DSM19430T_11710 [Desulfovibrio psychrotolerans]
MSPPFRNAVFVLALLLLLPAASRAEQLTVGYIEYPPYYFTHGNGTPGGLLMDITTQILDDSGVSYTYKPLPSKRILSYLEDGRQDFASTGWFKTLQRESFAIFSLPIYRNKPVGLVSLREKAHHFARYGTLREIMESGLFTAGLLCGHSEGEYIDGIMTRHENRVMQITGEQAVLMRMLAAGRFDFVLLPPEEVPGLALAAGETPEAFTLTELPDIPAGNTRHIMFSRAVSPDMVERINNAIRSRQESIPLP